MATEALWQAHAAGEVDAREQLLAEHLPLVRHIAQRVRRRLGAAVELDELMSAGTMGLMDALERFDPSRGLKFSTFAVPRIRGAMIDELRRLDHVPSTVRRRTRSLVAARSGLANQLGRAPRARETAGQLGIDMDTLWRWQADAASTVRVELDRSDEDHDGDALVRAEALMADDGTRVEDALTFAQEAEVLREAIMRLTLQERIVLTLSFYEDLKLQEIAEVLDVTVSRISQIRTRVIEKLRAEMQSLRSLVA